MDNFAILDIICNFSNDFDKNKCAQELDRYSESPTIISISAHILALNMRTLKAETLSLYLHT